MSTNDTKALLTRFLCAKEAEVLSWFAELQGAHVPETGKYVYVPGKRADRILLVAHADTIVRGKDTDIIWVGDICMGKGVLYSDYSYLSEPLGADDRAGCAMLWNVHDGQHSLLVTTGEEKGLLGARAAAKEMEQELKKHVFAIEIDRRGDRHAVFYNIATPAFKAYILGLLNKSNPDNESWQERQGSCTDISHICGSTRICGVNLSAGYLNEHSGQELLFLSAWLNTQSALVRVLQEEKHLPFRLAKKAKVALAAWGAYDWCNEHVCYKTDCSHKHREQRVYSTIALPSGKKLDIPYSVSKRGFKKLGRKIRRLVDKGELTKEEGERITQEVQDRRDGKPPKDPKQIITGAQREEEHWTGDAWTRQASPFQCWHYCASCKVRWYHNWHIAKGCKLHHDCLCPTHSDTVVKILERLSGDIIIWGYAPTLKLKPVYYDQDPKERVYCVHYCDFCQESWRHLKPRSGACKVKQHDSHCPGHSKENFRIVQQYELECKCPVWASALKLAASTEPELDAAIAAKALNKPDMLL